MTESTEEVKEVEFHFYLGQPGVDKWTNEPIKMKFKSDTIIQDAQIEFSKVFGLFHTYIIWTMVECKNMAEVALNKVYTKKQGDTVLNSDFFAECDKTEPIKIYYAFDFAQGSKRVPKSPPRFDKDLLAFYKLWNLYISNFEGYPRYVQYVLTPVNQRKPEHNTAFLNCSIAYIEAKSQIHEEESKEEVNELAYKILTNPSHIRALRNEYLHYKAIDTKSFISELKI